MTYSAIIAIVIIAGHITAFCTFEATYWIDSLSYISIGDTLLDSARLKNFYDGVGRWAYSHVGVGLPFVWAVMKVFPVSWRWPSLALFQHSVAAASCWLGFAWAIRSTAYSIIAVLVLNFLPFYQSGHQMLMTESFFASFLLIAVALAVRLTSRHWSESIFGALLLTLFLIAQFRVYFGPMVATLAAFVIISTGTWRSTRAIVLAAIFGASVLAFPA